MSLYSDILFWFRANESLLFLVNAACLAEKQHIPIFIIFGFTRPGLEPTIYRTRGEHANHYATDAAAIKDEHKINYIWIVLEMVEKCRVIKLLTYEELGWHDQKIFYIHQCIQRAYS